MSRIIKYPIGPADQYPARSTKYVDTIGDGSTNPITVTHNLGTDDVISQARLASDDSVVWCEIENTSTTQCTFTFAVAPATDAIKIVILS